MRGMLAASGLPLRTARFTPPALAAGLPLAMVTVHIAVGGAGVGASTVYVEVLSAWL